MSDEQRPQPELWAQLRSHPAFQAAVVFGGGSWLVLQAADVFGMATETVRVLGIVIVCVLVLLVGYSLISVLRGDRKNVMVARARTRTVALATAALLILGTGAWFARPYVMPPLRPGAEVIAVLPFSATGSGVDVLGEGLVDLLSTNLNEVGILRTINPRTSLHHYHQIATNGSIDLPGQLRVGERVGAGSVLVGSVVSTGSEVRISAELYSVETGSVIAKAQESGRADSVLTLVDQLSVQLMQDIWRSRTPLPELRVSAITSQSIPAIKAYLRGEQFYRGVLWDSAAAAFQEAVSHDSTFALAHFRLGETYGWRESLGSAQATLHSDAAARFADRLPARERALIVSHQLHEQGRVAAIDSLVAYVNRFPDDVAGHYFLADARYHAGAVLGLRQEDMLSGFERARAMDSTFAPIYAHLLELSVQLGDSARFHNYIAQYDQLAAGEAAVYSAMGDVRWGDREDALHALGSTLRQDGMRNASIGRLMTASNVRAMHTGDVDFVFSAIDSLVAVMGETPQIQVQAAGSRTMLLGSLGRTREAELAVQPLRANNAQQSLNFMMPLLLTGILQEDQFVPEREALRSAAGIPGGAYWLAIMELMNGNVDAAEPHIQVIRKDGVELGFLHPKMIEALEGWVLAARGDTAAGVERMKTALYELGYGPSVEGPSGVLRMQLAMLQTTMDSTRAEGIRRLEALLRQDPAIATFIARPLAEAYVTAGRTDDAALLYQRFINYWDKADPHLQPYVQSARDALARLTAERTGG